MARMIAAAAFQANCLRIIKELSEGGESVTITNRGRPVAVLSPVQAGPEERSVIGAMTGSVLTYDDPFRPAVDSADRNAAP